MGAVALAPRAWSARWSILWPALLIAVAAYFTYVHRYWHPPYLFWDENYHVASAQRYLHGTFFMEPHPPLGKLVIALGEAIVEPEANGTDDQFVGIEHAPETPEGFSFAGYRLLPTLFAWLVAPLLYGVFWLLLRDRTSAGLLSSLYVFDNAIIVHSRSAMLEPVLEFFVLAMILLFLLLLEWRDRRLRFSIGSFAFGACLGGAVTTKLTGLVMILLFVPIVWKLVRAPQGLRRVGGLVFWSALGFVMVFCVVWQIHFSLARNVDEALPEKGFYQASQGYRQVLERGESGSIRHFPTMLRDSLAFIDHYQQGVPKLDLCKEGENGSPWFLWPIGARAINYRWETPGGDASAPYYYLYLQSNPVAWLLGLTGVVLAGTMLIGSLVLPLRHPLERRFLLTAFFGLWLGYMVAISRLDRVMYLYHYFLPLLFSFILFGLVVFEIRRIGRWKIGNRLHRIVLVLCAIVVVGAFVFYRPLTYYQPITDAQFQRRSLIRLWDLHCVRCDSTSPLVRRTCP